MAITVRAVGTQSGSGAAVTAVTPTIPAGIVAGDITLLGVAVKPYNATITTPAGWTKFGEWTNGTVGAGLGTGSMKLAVYYRLGAITAGLMPAIGETSADAMVANMVAYATSIGSWDITGFTTGGDTTDDTDYQAPGSVAIPLTTGDVLLAVSALNSISGSRASNDFAGLTGITLGGSRTRTWPSSNISNQCALYWIDEDVTAGTATNVPTYLLYNTAAIGGETLILRLRDGGQFLTATVGETVGVTDAGGTAEAVQAVPAESIGVTDTSIEQAKDEVTVVGETVGATDTALTVLATRNASTPLTVTATPVAVGMLSGSASTPVSVAVARTASAGPLGVVGSATAIPVAAGFTASVRLGAIGSTTTVPAAVSGITVSLRLGGTSDTNGPSVTAGRVADGSAQTGTGASTPVTAAVTAVVVLGFRNTTAQAILTASSSASGSTAKVIGSTSTLVAGRVAGGTSGLAATAATATTVTLTVEGAVLRTGAAALAVVDTFVWTADLASHGGASISVAAAPTSNGAVANPYLLGAATPVTAGFPTSGSSGAANPSTVVPVAAAFTTVAGRSQSSTATATAVTVSAVVVGAKVTQSPSPVVPVAVVVSATGSWGSGVGQSTPPAVIVIATAAGSASTNPGSSLLPVTAGCPAVGSTVSTNSGVVAVAAGRAAVGVVGKVGVVALTVTAARTETVSLGATPVSTPTVVRVGLVADGRAYYGTEADLDVRFRFVARGVSQRLPTSLVTDLWYQSLPAAYREVDGQNESTEIGRPLYWFLDALTSPLDLPMRIATRIRNGELTDAVLADDAWIPWLAQAAGVSGHGVAELRARLLALQAAPALASNAYLVALIKPMLTGTQFVQVYPNPPWTITVAVNAGELGNVGGTTDGLRAAVYATGRVPTGFLLVVTSAAIQTWGQIDAVTSTWADVAGDSWKTVDSAGV